MTITRVAPRQFSANTPAKNQVLMYNGTNPVWAAPGTTFTFSINAFGDGEGTSQLIGNGVWKAPSSMSFIASYSNPPPTTATVEMSNNGGAYSSVGSMTAPAYTSGTNSGNISYPSAKDQTLRFRLSATDGTDSDIEYDTAITFYNYKFWGTLNKKSGITEADVESLSSELSSAPTGGKSINATAGLYLIWAYPASYSSIHATGFLFNSVTCPFEAVATVSITNSAGYTENYKVYASTSPNLGNSILSASTSSQLINRLYYGKTSKTSSYNETDVEGLANSTVSNDNTQTWNSVTTGVGEYLLFAFPTRLGIPTFYVGGFAGGFQLPETVSVTNVNGYSETYYVWRSTNSNLGAVIVTTA